MFQCTVCKAMWANLGKMPNHLGQSTHAALLSYPPPFPHTLTHSVIPVKLMPHTASLRKGATCLMAWTILNSERRIFQQQRFQEYMFGFLLFSRLATTKHECTHPGQHPMAKSRPKHTMCVRHDQQTVISNICSMWRVFKRWSEHYSTWFNICNVATNMISGEGPIFSCWGREITFYIRSLSCETHWKRNHFRIQGDFDYSNNTPHMLSNIAVHNRNHQAYVGRVLSANFSQSMQNVWHTKRNVNWDR